jgi:hypothetical protein
MLTSQIILLVIAVFFLFFGCTVNTKNITSAIFFKFVPILSSILLTLIAFGLIV